MKPPWYCACGVYSDRDGDSSHLAETFVSGGKMHAGEADIDEALVRRPRSAHS